jgi:uncharacterized protein YwgA
MTLLLTGSREHALLGMIVQEAAEATRAGGGYLGRTAMQKIPYFLKILGVPMGYRFDLHHYGTYCQAISTHIDWLVADQVIVDNSNNQEKYSRYQPGPALNELLSMHETDLEPHRETIRDVVRALLPLSPERLELIATLHYLYREQHASGDTGPWKDRVLARFLEVKKEKFPEEQVSVAYDQLVQAGLLEC